MFHVPLKIRVVTDKAFPIAPLSDTSFAEGFANIVTPLRFG
jgi:hypothetical protein